MKSNELLAIGLDMGTGGARAVALTLDGNLVAQARSSLPNHATTIRGPLVEQDPTAWQAAVENALGRLTADLPSRMQVVGLAVDATSGTFLLVDSHYRPLTPGIMYNDLRGADDAPEAAAALDADLRRFGIEVAPSFALPKILHLARTQPSLFQRVHRVVHQTDWIVGALSGRYDITDVSTGLKTGVIPNSLKWPRAIESQLGIPIACLPKVVLPGTPIGHVTDAAASRTGLTIGIPIVAGCTDGTAGSLASGARQHGDLNVTLGSTLVFKAVADDPLVDPLGAIYNHRHPGGGFLPGAASSTGAEWIQTQVGDVNLETLTRAADSRLPTGSIVYPLAKHGERFPFSHPEATGFGFGQIEDPAVRFAAGMEGVAMLERMGIERMEQLGLSIGPTVFATGGASANDTWLKIRAAVTRRVYQVPRWPECAVGAAVLAAMPTLGSFANAAAAIVATGRTVDPDQRLAERYDSQYASFLGSLRHNARAIARCPTV